MVPLGYHVGDGWRGWWDGGGDGGWSHGNLLTTSCLRTDTHVNHQLHNRTEFWNKAPLPVALFQDGLVDRRQDVLERRQRWGPGTEPSAGHLLCTPNDLFVFQPGMYVGG